MTLRFRGGLAALVLTLLLTNAAAATTITIVNTDAPNEGFNDPTPAAPIGGNTGTTIGQQRLKVFQAAAGIWAGILTSSVPIRVQSSFDPLNCTANSAVLGSAGPQTVDSDFPGAERPQTWYVTALANKLASADLEPGIDDIQAQFNSSIGGATCLNGRNWYYGLDHNEGGTGVDLLAVVLHELGHGLGFLSLVDGSTGQYLANQPDIFTHYLRDQTLGLGWESMGSAQRVASSTNTGNLVWDGPAVTSQVHNFLQNRAELAVTAPSAISGSYGAGEAMFGPPLTVNGQSGELVDGVDDVSPAKDGCSSLTNGAALSGKVALIDRGTCGFSIKARNAQDAGAIGIVVVNNVAGDPPYMTGVDNSITIPAISITMADGATLRNQMSQGKKVMVRLGRSATNLSGADNSGRALLYAPNPYQGGSSVSHFDVSATPNLLMEPAINTDLTSSVDLTRYAFEDIGWLPHVTAVAENRPISVGLKANIPNPFQSSTSISFELAQAGEATLAVYDVAGRLVTRLMNGHLEAGPHQAEWNARDGMGRDVSPGIYFYRLTIGGVSEAKRMVVTR